MRPKKRKYKSCDEVYKHLRDYFFKKNFEIGEKIPPERDIASELKVNRTTLRTAMKRLAKDGIVERQIGVGTFFKTCPKKLSQDYTRVKTECCPVELIKIRMMLEPQVASIAALNTSTQEIKQLRGMCQLKKKYDVLDIETIDIDFHNRLVEIAKNTLLSDIYSVISCARNKELQKCSKKQDMKAGFLEPEIWIEHQERLLDAFERKSSIDAENAVIDKLQDIMKLHNRLMN